MAYIQHRAGHSQSAITERYIHAAQVMFPGAAARGGRARPGHVSRRLTVESHRIGVSNPRCAGRRGVTSQK